MASELHDEPHHHVHQHHHQHQAPGQVTLEHAIQAAKDVEATRHAPLHHRKAAHKIPQLIMPVTTKEDMATAPKTPADHGKEFWLSPHATGAPPVQVYELKLEEDGGPNEERAYTRLPPAYTPYVLRVSLAAGTPPCRNGVFRTNFPLEGGKFDREKFVDRQLPNDFSKPINIDLPISHAGAFVYWIEYDGPNGRVKSREGYFNVDPILTIKKRQPILDAANNILSPSAGGGKVTSKYVNIPLDGLNVLTAVSKWMGPLPEWAPHLTEASERGYNMIHWTPLQLRGQSQSPYSLKDQHAFDTALFEKPEEKDKGVARVAQMMKTAKEDYGLLSLIDIVLNHTADNSEWLKDHPEAGFSPANSPHLTPALLLDDCIVKFSSDVASKGLPTSVNNESDMTIILEALKKEIAGLDLWQFYVLDVAKSKAAVKEQLTSGTVAPWTGVDVAHKSVDQLAIILKGHGLVENLGALSSRFCARVDPAIAASYVSAAFVDVKEPEALAEAWSRILDIVNVDLYREWEEDTRVATENIRNRMKYTRLDEHGPKWGEITAKLPVMDSYFTRLDGMHEHKEGQPCNRCLANNGWIWDADPLINFAQHPSKAYLRREVIAWGDCVKLRYGTKYEDNPWLWDHMTEYCQSLAGMFDGFRIDNCHSTPLHVGVYLLDKARVVNPNLYVAAELFTGNEKTDLVFVSRLGINSLIREAYNGYDTKEFSRLLYRYGIGKSLGSMDAACLTSPEDIPSPFMTGHSRPGLVTPLQGSMPHALLFDLTHDNETPLLKRSAEDALSTGALCTFSWSAIGSVKGFDDIYPKHLNIVNDNRHYEVSKSGEHKGAGEVKRLLNHLHTEMVLEDYSEGYVDQDNEYIAIHREQPVARKGYFLIAHTAFRKDTKERGWVKTFKLPHTKVEYIYGASIEIPSYDLPEDPETLRGLPATLHPIKDLKVVEGTDGEGSFTEITVPDHFPPGSIMVFKTSMQKVDPTLDEFCKTGAQEAMNGLSLVEMNVLLHRCEGEERDATAGKIGAYHVPNMAPLVYCGLEGWMHPLRHIMGHNDLGHPLCSNLRNGTWAMDYVVTRLEKQAETFPQLATIAKWFKERFDRVKDNVPSFLRPKYFAIIIFEAYKAARRTVMEQGSPFIANGHSFTQDLALCSIQMYGLVQSASLNPGKPVPCLAAGLPHFSASWARTWGRDVFISLRGLFLTTGNYQAAKEHILAFCSTLKHGLIPNLLDSIRNPRYNSRDSPWWMLQNIQDYTKMVDGGVSILQEEVPRRFPLDDTWIAWDDPKAYSYSSSVADIVQEILQRHALGIQFREHNAGGNLDMQMSDEGFNIDIHVDWTTGIIYGGNGANCGTWMDKMGESVRARTKGQPGTPRDGAPVEIIGLLYSTLKWVNELVSAGAFPHKGVEAQIDGKLRVVTYKEWMDLLKANFEKHFYVPLKPEDDEKYAINSRLVNRRGIYKDVYGTPQDREWSDYQLRCNFPIAMIVAPDLFTPELAFGALKLADELLLGPLGMKTLDPGDNQYRPYYDNSNDSEDASVAKGRNYHQGPEWGWPIGYFLRAYLYFARTQGVDLHDVLHKLHGALLPFRNHIQRTPWAGIPELTNKDGAECHDACPTQAWSASTLLDFLQEVHALQTHD